MRRRLIPATLIVLGLCFLVLFIGGGSRHAIGLVLKPMVQDIGWERSVIGAGVGLFMLTNALVMAAVGRLSDRLPVSWIFTGGFVLSAVGLAAMIVATEPWQVLLFYGVIFAAGNGTVSVIPVGVMIVRQFPERAASANAIAIAGMGLGQLVILSGMSVVQAFTGWQQVFLGLAVINLLLVPLLIWNAGRERTDAVPANRAHREVRSLNQAFGAPIFWILLLVYAICGMHVFFVSTHIVAFATDHGVGPLMAGNLLAFMGLAGLIGVIATGIWCDRSGPLVPLIASFVIRCGLFAAVMLFRDPFAIAVFALLFGMTFWMSAAILAIYVRDTFGVRNLGTITGIITAVHHVFGGIGAFAGALNFDVRHSYDDTFIVMGITAVIATLGSVALLRRADRHAHG